MTTALHIPARRDAPIACDMATADDTPAERLAAYRRLFARALLRRERRDDAVVFAFRPDAATTVEELARREATCCPFLDYRIESVGDELVWTTTGDPEASVKDVLDAFYALPDQTPAMRNSSSLLSLR